MEEPIDLQCPYCSDTFTTFVDISAGSQSYIEDCQTCCKPIQMTFEISEGEVVSSHCDRS